MDDDNTMNDSLDTAGDNVSMQGQRGDVPSETTIEMGGQLIEAMGNDLAAAASGHRLDVDMDNARLRLRDVQTALVSLGYSLADDEDDVEHIESGDSRALSETIRLFQDENDLDVSGRIDRDTYEAIMRSFEQALGVMDHGDREDDFHFLHTSDGTSESMGLTEQGMEQAEELSAEDEGLDVDDPALLNLPEDLAAGIDPQELEDL